MRGIENLNLSGECVELGSDWFTGTGILSCIAPSSGTIASVVSMTSMCGTLPKYRSAAARHGLPDWRHFPAEECGYFRNSQSRACLGFGGTSVAPDR